MPYSRNLNTYLDVVQVLKTARQLGGGFYTLPSVGAAVNWVARAYYYRKLLIQNAVARAGNPKGFIPTTEWDDMRLLRAPKSPTVKITFTPAEGTFAAPDGAVVELIALEAGPSRQAEEIINTMLPIERKPGEENDDLFDEAAALKKNLGLE